MPETLSQSAEPLVAITAAQLVRATPCPLCWALPGVPCRSAFLAQPSADHVARWLDTYRIGLISRNEVGIMFRVIVVVTKWQLVPERAA